MTSLHLTHSRRIRKRNGLVVHYATKIGSIRTNGKSGNLMDFTGLSKKTIIKGQQ